MKIALCGPGRSGKDVAAIFLAASTPLRYSRSTSQVIAPHAAKRLGLTLEAAFARRHADRMLWYEIGNELRRHDAAYLARDVLRDGDILVGVRDRLEMEAVRAEGLVDLAIWIDRDVPPDPTLGYGPELCDVIIPNNWDLPAYHARLERLARALGIWLGDGEAERAAEQAEAVAWACG